MSDSVRPHRQQPTRLPRPWDSPGKNTGVGHHFLLQCMKVKSESEVTQSCPTLATPWTAAYQASPSMGFSRQKYWSGVPLPSPLDTLYRQPTLEIISYLVTAFTCTFHFHALEKEMATHSSVLSWRIPGTGEPGGLPSMGSHRVGHD